MPQTNLSRDQRLMICFSAMRNIADLFLGTFLISFLMHLSANEIVSVSMYRLFEYLATCAGFFILANWCKRYNKVAVFALNLIPKIALLCAIIFLGDRVVEYIIPLGLLYGIGAAMYHLPMNTMVGEKVDNYKMGRFIGTKSAVNYAVKIISPIVLGFFIDTGSYTQMAYTLLIMSCVELVMIFFMSPSRHRSCKNTDFIGFWRCMLRFPVVRRMFASEVLRGFGLGLLGTVITMYTVYMFKTDLNLGIFTTVFSGCSVATSWALGRFGKHKYYPYILVGAMVAILGAMTLFVWQTVPATFLIYNFIYATAIVLLDQICSVNMFKLSRSKCVTKNHKVEYFVFRDFALFIGRWIGFTGLMYIGVFGGYEWLRWYLVIITAALLSVGAMSVKLSRNIRGR
ncbi:MAG: MFS transporter [Alphaproteobacteria bacterium]|nr:MFS transporter [Alphaproteobacteria bacterium]